MALLAVFGGVFGAVIGFLIFAATAVLLALPYFLLDREGRAKSQRETKSRSKDEMSFGRP